MDLVPPFTCVENDALEHLGNTPELNKAMLQPEEQL